MMILILMLLIRIKNDTREAEAPHNDTHDPAPAHTPDNPADIVSGPPSGMDRL